METTSPSVNSLRTINGHSVYLERRGQTWRIMRATGEYVGTIHNDGATFSGASCGRHVGYHPTFTDALGVMLP